MMAFKYVIFQINNLSIYSIETEHLVSFSCAKTDKGPCSQVGPFGWLGPEPQIMTWPKPLCFSGGSVVNHPPANAGDVSSIPGLERSLGGGNGSPLQHGHSTRIDTEAWRAAVLGVAKSQARLSTHHAQTLMGPQGCLSPAVHPRRAASCLCLPCRLQGSQSKREQRGRVQEACTGGETKWKQRRKYTATGAE